MASTPFAPTQARALVRAVLAIFFVNGVMVGVWGGSLPGLRDRVGTDAGGIGALLLITGLSAIVSMQVGGRLSDRLTPRLPALVGGSCMVAALVVVALAPNYATLVAGAFLIGAGNGTMDVAMNTLGVDAEKAAGTAAMSRFHAFFSLGGFVGSALVLGLARLQPTGDGQPRTAILVSAGFAAVALAVLWRATPRAPRGGDGADAQHAESTGDAAGFPARAWLLGVMALFFGFTEGTAIDWASIHVTDVAHVDAGTGAAGLVAVSATMVLIRLAGDALVERFGRAAVVRFGAPVAVLGYLVAIFQSSFAVILTGWLLVGLGVGMIAPQIYAIAGHLGGGRVLAVVTGFGYTAFLAGPGLVGFLSNHFGIQRAMVLPLAAGVALTLLTFTGALREPERA